MAASSKPDTGVFDPARLARALVGTALTAALAVAACIAVTVDPSNIPDRHARPDGPRSSMDAASDPSLATSGAAADAERPLEGLAALF